MPSIFSYIDYRQFLRDVILERSQKNASYSIRAFAQSLGLSPTVVNRIINGHRNITGRTRPIFSSGLRLCSKEDEYFGLLIGFN